MSDYTKAIIEVHNQKPETLESLRQRVKELEGYEQECANLDAELKDYQNCLAELAALKAKQGEPVAWTRVERDCCDEYFNAIVWAVDTNGKPPDGDKMWVPLYTSAPTIPEGWQLVPIEPLHKLLEYSEESNSARYGTLSTRLVRDLVEEALAAAPKPEE